MQVDERQAQESRTERAERILLDAMYPNRPEPPPSRGRMIVNLVGWLVILLIPILYIQFAQ